jgi:hypothetical protein
MMESILLMQFLPPFLRQSGVAPHHHVADGGSLDHCAGGIATYAVGLPKETFSGDDFGLISNNPTLINPKQSALMGS